MVQCVRNFFYYLFIVKQDIRYAITNVSQVKHMLSAVLIIGYDIIFYYGQFTQEIYIKKSYNSMLIYMTTIEHRKYLKFLRLFAG